MENPIKKWDDLGGKNPPIFGNIHFWGSVKAPFINESPPGPSCLDRFAFFFSIGRCHSFFSREASRSTYMGDVFPIWDMFPICDFQYVLHMWFRYVLSNMFPNMWFSHLLCLILGLFLALLQCLAEVCTIIDLIALCQKLMFEFRPQFKTLAGADLFDTSNLPSRNSGFTVWLTR